MPTAALRDRPELKGMTLSSTTFGALGVPAPLVEILAQREITTPTPIQAATLPDSLAGRDVLGRGRTGSGKTTRSSCPCSTRLSRSTTQRQPASPARPHPGPDPRARRPRSTTPSPRSQPPSA
jgi:superfamily II DNA/RNA helicase